LLSVEITSSCCWVLVAEFMFFPEMMKLIIFCLVEPCTWLWNPDLLDDKPVDSQLVPFFLLEGWMVESASFVGSLSHIWW
jgi:hypothetical protein